MIRLIGLLGLSCTFSACVSPGQSFAPTVSTSIAQQNGHVVGISVSEDPAALSSGNIKMPFGATNAADQWKVGLASAIEQAKAFDGSDRAYEIRVTILKLKPPTTALTVNTPAEARYQIIDAASREVVFGQEFKTVGHVALNDSFVGGARIQMSVDRAVQSNILAFISRLSDKILIRTK